MDRPPVDPDELVAALEKAGRLAYGSDASEAVAVDHHTPNCGFEDTSVHELPVYPLPGTVLDGKYEIEHEIGRGGSGVVYHARHLPTGGPLAIKVCPFGDQRERVAQQLYAEALILAHVSHPNVIKLWDYGQHAQYAYLVTEYVHGQTLTQRVAEQGPLSPDVALGIAGQCVDGLEALWQFEIVHRDIKPDNILIAESGRVLLADLGLAAFAGERPVDSEGIGTASYMSPEQIHGRASADPRTDIYALGVTMYQALTGTLPFKGRTRMQVLLKHLKEPLPPARGLRPDLPEPVCRLLSKMLAKAAGQRHGSYEELREEIQAALAG